MNDKYHMNNDSTLYMTALSMMKSVGPATARKLITLAGSAKGVFERKTLNQANYHILPKVLHELKDPNTLIMAEKELKFAEKNNIRVLTYYDSTFPFRLKQCSDSPLVIFKKGSGELESRHMLAIVGTRKATNYGRSVCKNLIEGLMGLDVTIVSGMALGIDETAHNSAIDNGINTIAVLGHDLTKIFPSQHRDLSEKITENGSLLTEFSRSEEYNAWDFPSRNRIIAGLVDATVVIESAEKGGSLITADLSNSYNRDVFAFPGRTSDEFSKGCNSLIKGQGAAMIESAQDLMEMMNWNPSEKALNIQIDLFECLNESEKEIAHLIKKNDVVGLDFLLTHSSLNISELCNTLLHLEFKNIVASLPGKVYSIKA
jgi:DNA processing protein